jgi:cytochrome c oxidase subunit 4
MSEQSQHAEHEHHIVSPKVYLVIVLALLFFTGLTVWASFIDLGPWNPVIALAIACTKAVLVVLFFMHVKYSSKLTKLTVIAGIFIFLGLISMTLADYMSRAWGRW